MPSSCDVTAATWRTPATSIASISTRAWARGGLRRSHRPGSRPCVRWLWPRGTGRRESTRVLADPCADSQHSPGTIHPRNSMTTRTTSGLGQRLERHRPPHISQIVQGQGVATAPVVPHHQPDRRRRAVRSQDPSPRSNWPPDAAGCPCPDWQLLPVLSSPPLYGRRCLYSGCAEAKNGLQTGSRMSGDRLVPGTPAARGVACASQTWDGRSSRPAPTAPAAGWSGSAHGRVAPGQPMTFSQNGQGQSPRLGEGRLQMDHLDVTKFLPHNGIPQGSRAGE